jgi:hypothetical protein
MKKRTVRLAGAAVAVVLGLVGGRGFAAEPSILNQLSNVTTIATTVPGNGDINPYGLVKVPATTGNLEAGSYLVSNFNASSNFQGTGTTIVEIAPDGDMSLFAQIDPTNLPGPCPGGVGLTTALAVLRTGWVIVGSLPTTDGTSATASAGCLLVLNSSGTVVETLHGSLINGPWDMTSAEYGNEAEIFFSNVLNGTVKAGGNVVHQGTVVRMNLSVSTTQMPEVTSMTVIGSGFPERTDPAALVIGPTGLGLSTPKGVDADDFKPGGLDLDDRAVLYVADSLNNRIAAIPSPMTRRNSFGIGQTFSIGGALNDPLGVFVAADGHVLTVNGNNGRIIEIDTHGNQIATKLIDNTGNPPGSGTLFGVLYDPAVGVVFVDDGSNTLNLLH